MRDQLAETIVGFLVLLVAGGFVVYSLGAANGGGTGYALRSEFPAVDGLKIGSEVRLAGVPVGSVKAIEFDEGLFAPVVTFTVRDGLEVPADSTLKFKAEGLLGGSYLSLVLGADEEVAKAGDLLMEPGQGPIDVFEILTDVIGAAATD